jgi:RNA polymerase sigma factor (sigma-70 family)
MSDIDLWRQLKTGEHAALERIYREHAGMLLRYGRKFALDEPLVEDCVQDLFIDLWRRRENLSDTDSIRKYLLVALRRRVVRALERRRKQGVDAPADDHAFRVDINPESQMIDEELDEERGARLQAAFAQLSEREREIIYLKYQAGLEYEEIEAVMGISYQSARNLATRALRRLRECLALLIFCLLEKVFAHV